MKSQRSSPRNSKYELTESEFAAFWSKVEKTDDCWNWTGAKDGKGYGKLRIRTEQLLAHRVAFRDIKGFLPEAGLVLDHLCNNTGCVNPEHLNVTTIYLNASRSPSFWKARTLYKGVLRERCKAGHDMSLTRTHGWLRNRCRTCHLQYQAIYRRRTGVGTVRGRPRKNS